MIIQYIDKPIEQMDLEELRMERSVQTWIKERVRRERRDLAYQMQRREEYLKKKVPSWNEIDSLQIRKLITKDEAKRFRLSRARREGQIERCEDRLAFADLWLLHMNAYLKKIDERIEIKKYGKEVQYGTRARKKDSVHESV